MPILNASGRTAPDTEDAANFLTAPTLSRLSGPLKLYRFGSTEGRWWYEQALLDEIKEDFLDLHVADRSRGSDILNNPRNSLAVSREWNNFQWFCTMRLGPDQSIECWTGPTAPQPEWQTKPDGRILHGGLTQLLIYDLSMFPEGLVERKSTAMLWRELSTPIGRTRIRGH